MAAGIESHKTPLAPAGKSSQKSGKQELILIPAISNCHRRHKSSRCLVYLLAITVLLAAVLLIFSSVVWHITSPHFKLTSLSLQTVPSHTNITILAKLIIGNNNFGRFQFDSCKAVVLHGNSTIGGGNIYGGSVDARGTQVMNVSMKVGTTPENLNASSSGSGLVELISYAEMTGKMKVMKIVKKKLRVELNCTMSLDLTNNSIQILLCK